MKKLLYLIVLGIVAMGLSSCLGDEQTKIEKKYAEWKKTNDSWLKTEVERTDASGNKYYTYVQAPWNTETGVYMHWKNDRSKTEGNLKPLFNSTVDVKYRLRLYDGTPIDSSYLRTVPADSIFRTQAGGSSLIEGWSLALMNMRVGDQVEVIVPYTLGYSSIGTTGINPFSVLIFDLELRDIVRYEGKN